MYSKLLRYLFCIIIVLAPFCLLANDDQSFAVISDTHVGSKGSGYLSLFRLLKEEQTKTIIHTGDAINNPGNTHEWKRFIAAQSANQSVHVAAGNHDITDKQSFEIYLKFFPKAYYSFADGDVIFILLNTEIPGEESAIQGKQLAWLETELKRPFRYKFVFLHEPLFPVVHKSLAAHEEARDMLHKLFAQNGVSLVIAGHDHIYHRILKDNIIYVIMPSASRKGTMKVIADMEPGYILATPRNGSYSFVLKDLQGKIKDEFLVTR